MRVALHIFARFYLWLWWHARVDPTGYIRPTALLFGTATAVVVLFLGSISVLSSILLKEPMLAAASDSRYSLGTAAVDSTERPSKSTRQQRIIVDGHKPVSAGPVPEDLAGLYKDAARRCDMSWEVLAAVGWVESHHGALDAAGVRNGANFAGARGPMQFLTPTWERYGVDADGNGKADVYNQKDAIHGAANYLCANGAGDSAKLRNALWHYNHSNVYVNNVLGVAAGYKRDTYAFPLPADAAKTASLTGRHHSYPAVDVMVPTGTPVTAAHGGKVVKLTDGRCGQGVVIAGYDGATYTYCHLSRVDVARGTVVAGDMLGLSGGAPGSRGAGSSTAPHLHLSIDAGGHKVCPQSLLVAWADGKSRSPMSAPTSGCVV